jgi:hypothetical protein
MTRTQVSMPSLPTSQPAIAWALALAASVGLAHAGASSASQGAIPGGCNSMTKSTQEEQGVRRATAAGVEFEWRIEGNVLKGRMSARTTGWVTVGFNKVRDLRGTRLVMGYVDGDRTVVEEHIADPPDHRPKVSLGGTSGVLSASGREQDGTTTIDFELLLDTGDSFDVPLVPGQSYFTTFAWSHEDDLDHHSASRSAIDLVL